MGGACSIGRTVGCWLPLWYKALEPLLPPSVTKSASQPDTQAKTATNIVGINMPADCRFNRGDLHPSCLSLLYVLPPDKIPEELQRRHAPHFQVHQRRFCDFQFPARRCHASAWQAGPQQHTSSHFHHKLQVGKPATAWKHKQRLHNRQQRQHLRAGSSLSLARARCWSARFDARNC